MTTAGRMRDGASNAAAGEAVVLVCGADAGYVMPLAVMLRSAIANLGAGRALDVYVVDGGIPETQKERVACSCRSERVTLHWLSVDRSSLKALPTWGRMSATTYDRLLVAQLLPPGVAKAIWLDCDMVVKADLGRLWTADLAQHHALAVQGIGAPYVSSRSGICSYRQLGIPKDAKYFNAGVMVLNLDLWRRDDVARSAIEYLQGHREGVFFWDQASGVPSVARIVRIG